MKKLKCSSCGGELEVEENKEYAKCKYCGARYKLNEDLNVNIRLDDNMKEVLNNGLGIVKHTSKFMLLPVIVFIIIFITIAFTAFRITEGFNEEGIKQEEKVKQQEEHKKYSFNFQFTGANGTKSAFFTQKILDDIIQSNKTNDRQVSLVYEGGETTNESEIIEIKHSLKGNYEVSLNYDDGYINKIIVEKIKD